MGAAPSCRIFETFFSALQWILTEKAREVRSRSHSLSRPGPRFTKRLHAQHHASSTRGPVPLPLLRFIYCVHGISQAIGLPLRYYGPTTDILRSFGAFHIPGRYRRGPLPYPANPKWREAGSRSNCNTEEGSGDVVRGQQRSGVRTQPAWARTKPARFASPSSGASSGGSDVDGDHTSQRPPAGTASQPPPLSADDWTTLQAPIAQARGPSHVTSLLGMGTTEVDPAAAATAALPPTFTDRRPRARSRGHKSRRRASSSSLSSFLPSSVA
ncbi:uncharacterized protein [Procambarus clarkii]|uniref:uncharacterized protein n=1 Tax=Procambarus clarkii TaxID=6728 RepID=UPI00374383B7